MHHFTSHLAACYEEKKIPVLKTVKTIKKVKTVALCWEQCKKASNCDYYKWKVSYSLVTGLKALVIQTHKKWKRRILSRIH